MRAHERGDQECRCLCSLGYHRGVGNLGCGGLGLHHGPAVLHPGEAEAARCLEHGNHARLNWPDDLSMATMQGRSLRIYTCWAEYELVQLPCPITNSSRGPDLWHAHCQHGPLLWVTQCMCCPGSHRLGNRERKWVHDWPDLLRCLQRAQTPLFCHDMNILSVLPLTSSIPLQAGN